MQRTPIDSRFHKIDLSSPENPSWQIVDVADGPIPPPRVGHGQAGVGLKIFIFGGRQGIEIDEKLLNDFYVFDTQTRTWSRVNTSNKFNIH